MLMGLMLVACESDPNVKDPAPEHTHTFSTVWAADEEYHWHAATCGCSEEVRDKEDHEFGAAVVTLEPTVEAPGSKTSTCETCGYEKIESIPQLEEVVVSDLVYQLVSLDGSASADKKASYNESSKTHVITINNMNNVGAIDLYLDDKSLDLTQLTISGDFGSDSSAAFYLDSAVNNSLLVGKASESVVITYNQEAKTLKIEAKEISATTSVNLTYTVSNGSDSYSGTAALGSGGKYYFDLSLNGFHRVLIYADGTQVTSSNTDITGAFKDQIDATWTKDLYVCDDNGKDLAYWMEIESNYTFYYTPASGSQKAQLYIEYHEPVIEEDGFVATAVQHVESAKTSGNTVTVKFNSGSNYGGVRLYYNGTEIVPSSVTVSGSGYYADWGSLNATSAKKGIYYQPDDGSSAPGWFTIASCTATFVYDATSNTLTITVA